MESHSETIGQLVRTIVEPLIQFPDDLEIISTEEEDGSVYVEMRVNEEDAGRVIGRQGRVIKSIRTLARAVGSRMDYHVDVELVD